jgi:hypothetical protein
MSIVIDITHARRPALFNADTDDGRPLVRARSTPFRDAARALLSLGLAAPGDVLAMRLDGHVALEATAGALAKLGPRSRWEPGPEWALAAAGKPATGKHGGARKGAGRPRRNPD